MKHLWILGVGAQRSAVAKQMLEEPNGSEIIYADYDEKAGLTTETYLTSQCTCYLQQAAKLDITVDQVVKTQL